MEPTEALIGQEIKRILLSLLMECWYNKRGHNWSHIIANTKYTKLALVDLFFEIRDTSHPGFTGFYHWSYPTPLSPPPPNIILFHSMNGHWSKRSISVLLKGFHHSSSPPPHLGTPKNPRFHLCLIITTIHEDLFDSVMNVVHGIYTPRDDESRYHVLNRNIIEVSNKLE